MTTKQRRLSVDDLRVEDVILTIDGTEYEIRGDLPIEAMIDLMMIHKRLDAISGETEDDAIEALRSVEQANAMIVKIVRERYPDATFAALGIHQLTAVLGFLVDNPGGPTAEVEETLVAGVPAPTEEEIQQRIAEAIERERLIREGLIPDDPPTIPSRSDSSTSSSPSGSTSTGAPNGGVASPGEPSEPTASTPTDT